jgi:hypothetical protein
VTAQKDGDTPDAIGFPGYVWAEDDTASCFDEMGRHVKEWCRGKCSILVPREQGR